MPWRLIMQANALPRSVMVWLLFSQAFLLLPHMLRYPALLIPVCLLCTVWRVLIFKQRRRQLSGRMKALLAVLALSAIIVTTRRVFTIDTMVLLLLLAFALKILEIKQRRDWLISIYLAYFVIATQCIYEQGLLSLAYLLISVALVTSCLIAAHSDETAPLFKPLKEALKLMLLSVPVMLLAFMAFPRIGPLWSLPSPSNTGKTGISDHLRPGSIAHLAQSDELAFRATFVGPMPALKQLYWRALSLSQFDGRNWSVSTALAREKTAAPQYALNQQNIYHYQLTMEPSHKRWIYALDGVQHIEPQARLKADYTLSNRQVIDKRQTWQVQSAPMANKIEPLTAQQRRIDSFWPAQDNPQTSQLAKRLWQQSRSADDYLQRVLDYFKQQHFAYSLSPPALDQQVIDGFLFTTKVGFCEHFAMAFAGLARAAGLPARIILGYQGGDINPYQAYINVRQLNAHAWVEVWLGERGWVRYDPTYAVAPTRIDDGGRQLDEQLNQLQHTPWVASLNDWSWLKNLQYRLDQLNYLWHNAVLSYDGQRQSQFLARFSLWQLAASVLLALAFSSLLVLAVYYYRQPRKKRSIEEKLYQRFLRQLARHGLSKASYQGVQDFAELASQRFPEKAADIQRISWQYTQLRYALLTQTEKQALLNRFRHHVHVFTL